MQNKDMILSYHRNMNGYETPYEELVDHLEKLLRPHRIVAYHCTRLTAEEIRNIKQEGLRVLTPALVSEKFKLCWQNGYLSKDEYEDLESSKDISDNLENKIGHRTGMVALCGHPAMLKDGNAVSRFFRFWGGEAVYRGNEDKKIGCVLRRIGTPCIVVCAVPFTLAKTYYKLSQFLLADFVSDFVSDEEQIYNPEAKFDLRIENHLSASEILDVIDYSDSRFENLTVQSGWCPQYQIK